MRRPVRTALGSLVVVLVVGASRGGQTLDPGELRCLSLTAQGDPLVGSHVGFEPAASANGRYATFGTRADNIDPADPSTKAKIYVRDLKKGTLVRMDRTAAGAPANGDSWASSVSAKGRYIAFYSHATNLTPGDANAVGDMFLYDRKKALLRHISLRPDGGFDDGYDSAPSISGSGKLVAYESSATDLVPGDTNSDTDIFVTWWKTGRTVRASLGSGGVEANDSCYEAALSGNGRFVAFRTGATNLVEADTNSEDDVFVRDLRKGVTTRVSVSTAGSEGNAGSGAPSISRSGRYVAFESNSDNLVPGDSNGDDDVFVYDRKRGVTTRVSVASDGAQGDADSFSPAMSRNGRYVAFQSRATNLDGADTNGDVRDIYVHDRKKGTTVRVALTAGGAQSAGRVLNMGFSGNGRVIVFAADADDFVPTDANGVRDAFVRRWR